MFKKYFLNIVDLLSDGTCKIKIMKKTLEKRCRYDQMVA